MNRLNTAHDDKLIVLLQSDSREAFDEIYHRYHKAIYQNVLRITKEPSTAEDIVQDVFFTLWQRKKDLQQKRSLSGWLFVISYHQSVNWLKLKLRDAKAKQSIYQMYTEVGQEINYDLQMSLLEKAIEQLPPQKKRAIELCKLQGKTYREAAKAMNISTHTIKEYLSGAIKTLRNLTLSHPEYKILTYFIARLFF